MPMGFEEEVYKLTLYKVILSNNDIINQIVKELNSIKNIMRANGYNSNDYNKQYSEEGFKKNSAIKLFTYKKNFSSKSNSNSNKSINNDYKINIVFF